MESGSSPANDTGGYEIPLMWTIVRKHKIRSVKPNMSAKTSENTIIENQEKILANQEQILANQLKLEEVLKNQTAIIENQEKLDKILANQEAILNNQTEILAK